MSTIKNPVFCALDTGSVDEAVNWAGQLKGAVGGMKLGLEFFGACGPEGVRAVAATGMPIFLDLKFHDIPNTVAGAIRSVVPLGAAFVNVHTTGGRAMMMAAANAATEAADNAGVARPLVLGVTVLTSMDERDLDDIGVTRDTQDQVVSLALLAQDSGLDGVVCSAREIEAIRDACGDDFALMVPGIRPAGADVGDQKRIMTPADAIARGADYLVIGRPITQAADPAKAAADIVDSLNAA